MEAIAIIVVLVTVFFVVDSRRRTRHAANLNKR